MNAFEKELLDPVRLHGGHTPVQRLLEGRAMLVTI
jgi:hypothetical protein